MTALTEGFSNLGRGIRRKKVGSAYKSAFMGKEGAMERLAGIDPQLARQLKQDNEKRKTDQDQRDINNNTNQVKRGAAFAKELKEEYENIANFETHADAKEYGDRKKAYFLEKYPEISRRQGFTAEFTQQDFDEAKTFYGEKESTGSFEGTGMPAQVGNMLVKGVNDPEFRNSPEYARAWQMANKPDLIDTEEGRIPLYPTINPMFKPPGSTGEEGQEAGLPAEKASVGPQIIPGTEKTKTSGEERKSLGYFNRMQASESNIQSLGDFDSASLWEKMKGVTNVTASPKMQQYRQAADDWIRSKLREESGAVIGPQEMQKEYEIYYPQFGDSQPVIDQKKGARLEAAKSMKISSGRAYKKEDEKKEDKNPPTLNEADLSVTIDGKRSIFPSIDQYNAYKKAAGL